MGADEHTGSKNSKETDPPARKGQEKKEGPRKKESIISPKESGKEEAPKPEKNPQNEAAAFARSWYQMQGRETILRFRRKLDRESITSFSVGRDGICTVKEGKRYRRIGVLRDFPGREMGTVAMQLKKDGFRASQSKDHRYLWVSWKREGVQE